MLSELESGIAVEEILNRMDSGLPKLWVLHRALKLRREQPEYFGPGRRLYSAYDHGTKSRSRRSRSSRGSIATIVPRWNLKLADNWSGTSIHLPNGRWRNLLTDDRLTAATVPMQTLLQRFPVALL